ncbi:GNAT family N-acetyltransferase [Peribacillus sp. NPDC097295]|uniref:GNAT family N-acetyltransferase n=1 Tax=Peribacillus sp. NPDC097295 TaxID=3364402 RepID=UPI00380F5C0A
MLIKYKKSYEKFAMGLLSFMPKEKEIKVLRNTMKNYETDENLQLFLWKDEEIIGLIGIQISSDFIEIQHISVNPSFRKQGIGKEMVRSVKEQYPDKELKANEHTESFIEKC